MAGSIKMPPAVYDGSPYGGGTIKWPGIQYTESEGHRKTRGRYREGGPFFTYRMEIDVPSVDINFTSADKRAKYNGPAIGDVGKIPSTIAGIGSIPVADSKHLDPYGTKAIAAVDPTNPNAQTGVALGEILKDRRLPIPGIAAWKRRTQVAQAAGSEYLNAVFGWVPLVSDMKNTAQSVKDGNTILENYSNASGSDVHREFAFPDIHTIETIPLKNGTPTIAGGAGVPGAIVGVSPIEEIKEITIRRWFSGSFSYTAQSGGSSVGKCLGYGSDADKLFGVALTPDLVWELAPWSWAIDWFSNASDVIHNVGTFGLGGLVMRYGYIMEEHSTVRRISMPKPDCIYGVSQRIPDMTITVIVKRRREANPFGFGLEWDGLSPTQLAITAALGITRLR